ncbi:amino acid adenylation domain-containing protein (plasmid) [Agrobacterium vitis]|uniref:amino acid adenylation domain-containing protein n=1 Tax=Agrobacterium vitis TaxID=373 RepID=UPI003D2E07F0
MTTPLAARRSYPVRVINWGYWGNVGSGGREGLAETFKALGIDPLDPQAALSVLPAVLSNPHPQVLAIEARPEALKRFGLSSQALMAKEDGVFADLTDIAVDQATIDAMLARYDRLIVLAEYGLLGALRRMGIFHRVAERHNRQALFQQLGIIETYRRLFDAALNVLAQAGYVQIIGDDIETTARVSECAERADGDGWLKECDQIAADMADVRSTAKVTSAVLSHYPEILRGNISAMEVLFPGGSSHLMEGLYRDNVLADTFNRIAAHAVRHYVQQRMPTLGPQQKIRIIEFGAGTGSTTRWVLEALSAFSQHVEYVYTDLSKFFLDRGAAQFAEKYDFVTFKLLDLERDAQSQDYEASSFDLVIATNVIHATRRIDTSLALAKQLLVPGGWVVINEFTRVTPLLTLSGGVLEGWWRFADEENRLADSPICSLDAWRRVLQQAGFSKPLLPGAGHRDLGQHVLLAQSGVAIDAAQASVPSNTMADQVAAVSAEDLSCPEQTIETVELQDDIREIGTIIAEVLKLGEEIAPDRRMADYGLDSLVGLRVADALQTRLKLTIKLSDFFVYPTLNELARYIGSLRPQQPRRTLPEAVAQDIKVSDSVKRGSVTRPAFTHPLSIGQKALADLERAEPGTRAYIVPFALTLSRTVDISALHQALQTVVDGHEQLRAVLTLEMGEPVWLIQPQQAVSFEQRDLSRMDTAVALETMRHEAGRVFDLYRGPLLRAVLFHLPAQPPVLLLCFHHIVIDGLSFALVLEQLQKTYAAHLAGRPAQLATPGSTYGQFVAWQAESLTGQQGERDATYWREQLAGQLVPQSLPYDRPRKGRSGLNGASLEGVINADLTRQLRAFAGENGASLSSVTLSAYLVLLYRFSLSEAATIGVVTAGRPVGKFTDVVGYFANLMILHTAITPDQDFRSLLKQVHGRVLSGLEHANLPLPRLLTQLAQNGQGPLNDLLRAAYYFQGWLKTSSSNDLIQGPFAGIHQEGEFDLTLDVIDGGETLGFTLKYDRELFFEPTIERLRDYLIALLHAVVREPERSIATLPLLSKEAATQMVNPLPPTFAQVAPFKSVYQLFTDQAERRPQALAVQCGDQTLRYSDLARRVDQLCHLLIGRGAGNGQTIGIFVARSVDMVVSLLAVMKAGAAYVPLDPVYPANRIAHILEDCKPKLIITTQALEQQLGSTSVPRLPLENMPLENGPPHHNNLPLAQPASVDENSTAYIIYTSGSTGLPKGVEVTHGGLANILLSMQQNPGFSAADRLFAVTTICFDIAAVELYLPLISGGSLVVAGPDDLSDGRAFRNALEISAATVVQATPSAWKMLLATGWQGNPALNIWTGGEAIDQNTADALLTRGKSLWNLYGPTETTIWSMLSRYHGNAVPTIGLAVDKTALMILNEQLEPVAPGLPGELFIGGAGVARGYYNKPELTAQRFIFVRQADGSSMRMFRTGDLVRMLGNGEIQYLERINNQVKIRGYRVELGEIENVMRRQPGVRDAAVVLAKSESADGGILRGFYVADRTLDQSTLQQNLPGYMIPAVLQRLEVLPRLPNGKTDRGRLATMDLDDMATVKAGHQVTSQDTTTKSGNLEQRLFEIVAQSAGLPLEKVRPASRFGELGLSSVGLTGLSEKLSQVFGITLSPTAFYAHPSVEVLARYVSTLVPSDSTEPHEDTAAEVKDLPSSPVAPGGTAIIGMAGRLPQSPDLSTFWDHITAGHDLLEEIPASRWDWRISESERGRWGGFIADVDLFDAAFFGISPREAALMDPQQRLLLETAWAAIENAGYAPGQLAGKRVGVFIGLTNSDYLEVQKAAGQPIQPHTLTGAALSIIPNRLSYLMDFRGPSLAVDTACSSALTAIYQAVNALRRGDCDLAIAGAVNLMLMPTVHETLSKNEMLSEDGRCKPFDRRANGYARGEGVGAIVLKGLEAAIRDRDPIQAVIRGVAINHGGKSASLTAPNPNAQAEVIRAALSDGDVAPDTISYIEAHGTGTALGDPIEIDGLNQVFTAQASSQDGAKKILIGSVKSNIGHLEAAAALAGLFKLVLSLKHGRIPGTVHLQDPNPLLDFTTNRLALVSQTQDWPVRHDQQERAYPRRAGLSSFGFGGANGHLVVEEWMKTPETNTDLVGKPLLFVVSARDRAALVRQVAGLAAFLDSKSQADLASVAATLQFGRDAMPHRLAIVAASHAALIASLQGFVEQGDVLADPAAFSAVVSDASGQAARKPATESLIKMLTREGNLHELAQLFVAGEEIDWNLLYPGTVPARIALPSYPFERTRHWVKAAEGTLQKPADSNFQLALTGQESFLRDHVVAGQQVFPGVGSLLLALKAARLDHGTSFRLENLIWVAPVIVPVASGATAAPLALKLSPKPDGLSFELLAGEDMRNAASAGLVRRFEQPHAALEKISLVSVLKRCPRQVSGQDCYARLVTLGVSYGDSFRIVDWLALGEHEALAELKPLAVPEDATQFLVSPAILDAPLQIAGLMMAGLEGPARDSAIPFSLQDITGDRARLPLARYVLVEKMGERLFNARFLSEDGEVVGALNAMQFRGMRSPKISGDPSQTEGREAALFQPVWRDAGTITAVRSLPQRLLVLDGTGDADARLANAGFRLDIIDLRAVDEQALFDRIETIVKAAGQSLAVVHLPAQNGGLSESVTTGFDAALTACRALISARAGGLPYLYLYAEQGGDAGLANATHAAMSAFAHSLRAETPAVDFKVVAHAPAADMRLLLTECFSIAEHVVALRLLDGRRQIRAWEPIAANTLTSKWSPQPDDGVYLITGGTGAIGLQLAEWLLQQAPHAKVVLSSRHEPSSTVKARLDVLNSGENRVTVIAADVTKRQEVDQLIAQLRARFGRISGLFHAAGVSDDGFILKKHRASADAVLAPKLYGLTYLDEATQNDDLAFFVAFSSTAAVFGNVGQADYAFANAFMDHAMQWRRGLVAQGLRRGFSLSINWPFWAQGGFQLPPGNEQLMKSTFGLEPLSSDAGLQALERALACDNPQVLVGSGDPQRLLLALNGGLQKPMPKVEMQPRAADAAADKTHQLGKALAALFAEELQLAAQEIDPALPLDGYGVDSFLSLSITRRLEDEFGTLPKTLLFEYVTLGELTGFLAGKDASRVEAAIKAFSDAPIDPTEEDPVFEPESDYFDHSPSMPLASLSSAVSERVNTAEDNNNNNNNDDIAIIGISGRFPQADTLQEFWRNLESGKDSIEIIPSERWDQEDYFDPEPGKPGKSYSKWGGFLKNIDKFDPMFFRMAQMEAEHIDPQERLFLQTVWHLLEDAGVTRQNLAQQRTGVFVGMMYGHYQLYGVQEALQGLGVATSSSYASVANRVSYFFNLNGPSIALDSMCSSALSSIHLASLSIRAGDCDVAIAGGVNVSSHPLKYVQLSRSGFLSRDGRCRSFGEGGTGYVPAEGVGAVLLKSLGAAKADGDRILAVVKASTLNHGGTGKGYSAPNPRAQGDLIVAALDRARLAPDEIDYIEAHGTGTSLGDPIEIAGLQRAFERDGKLARKIPIGSVKSNIGHAESAAGMAALSKVLLQLEHNRLAPSLHSETLNGNIDFAATPFEVQQQARDWPRPLARNGKPRARNVAISSFGAGGANAHLIVQEYIADHQAHDAVPPYVFALSAKDPEALSATLADFAAFLRHEGETVDPASLAWTLQVGREAFANRFTLVFDTVGDLLAQLDKALAGQSLQQESIDPNRQDKAHDLARQWLSGAAVDWPSLYPMTLPPRISLPGYAFRKDLCWLPQPVLPEPSPQLPPVVATSNPPRSASEDDVMHIRNLRDLEFELTAQTPIMAGHKVDGVATFPAVGYLDLIVQQFHAAGYPVDTLEISNLTAIQPLCVREEESLPLAQRAVSIAQNEWRVTIAPRDRADQEPYASARVMINNHRSSSQPVVVHNWSITAPKTLPLDAIYDRDLIRGQEYSGHVRASGLIEDTVDAFKARLVPPVADDKSVILAHPALLMAGAVAAGIADYGKTGHDHAYLPMYIQSFRLFAPLNQPCVAIIRKASMVRKVDVTQLDIRFVDEQGQILAELNGLASKLLQGQRRDAEVVTSLAHAASQMTAAQSRLRHLFAQHLVRAEETLPMDRGYYEMGIDSAEIIAITRMLGEVVGTELPPTLCFEHTNLRDLADHLALNFPAAFSSTAIDPPSHQAAGLLEQVRVSLDISHLQQTVQPSEMDRWIALALARQLVSSGRFSQADVSSKYQRWFDEAAELMEAEGLVSRVPDGIVLTPLGLSCVRGELEPQAKLARARFAADPNWAKQIEVVEHCLEHISGVIRGEIQATDLLFSGGNQSKVMALLRDNPLAIHLNTTLSAIVARTVEARLTQDGARIVRLAEVGAGTGSSTVEILPKIDRFANQINYWYTDISSTSLTEAENGLGRGRDYLRYALWNIEKLAGPDVIAGGPVDVMVASNVLHTTRNIASVLDHLAAGMRPGGLLILNEVTRKSAMLLCTFALLDGWWISEDGENRLPGTPMLDGQLWERALHRAGFGQTWRPLQVPGAFAEIIVAQYGPAHDPQPPQDRPQRLLKKDWQPAPTTGHLGLGEKRLAILATSASDALALRLKARLASAEIVTVESLPDVAVAKDFAAIVDLTGCSNTASAAGFDGWLLWLQKLVPHLAAGSLLMGVTCGLEDRRGAVRGDAAQRAALYRMLQSEYQKLRSRHVDLDAAVGIDEQVESIIQELGDDGDDNALVYRHGQRLRSIMGELALASSPAARPAFTAQDVLWITGGTRGIGLAIARHAVRHWGVRRLLLSGRDLLPPRAQWPNHTNGPLADKIAAIQGLEAQGAKVMVLSLPMDGTVSPSAMAQSVGQAEAELGRVSAVIHAAGTVDRAHLAFTGKPLAHIHDVLAPKTLGLDAILQCVQPERLRFLALFSSVAAAMPALAVGQSDYAMANAYMDHVAFMQQDALPIVSIQWPSWALGMGEATPGPVYASTGLGVLAEAEGLALLERILTQKLTGVVMPAMLADAAIWQPESLVRRRFGVAKAVAAQATPNNEDNITAAVPAISPSVLPDLTSATENWVIDILAGLLHFDKNRLHRDGALEDYGVDSIMTTEIVQTIHRELQVEIDPSAILEHSHISGFAGWLVKEHGEALARRLLPETQTPEVVSPSKTMPLNDTPKVTTVPTPVSLPERRQESSTDIAIIGLSARFPGAATPEDYWQLIRDGKSAITRVPQKRWGRQTNHFAGLIDDFGFFDPDYFLMSPQDVAAMDPQALLVMEEAIHACCDAGYRQDELRGREIGVYVGGRTKHAPSMERLQQTRNPVVVVGQNYLATNISRFLDLRGPSLVIDSACSSALTAISSAVSALRAGDIEMAMVAGVSLLSTDEGHEIFGQRGILATSPEFHAFDQRASGFVPSEGAGVVLLKPLAQARADGDRIRAVIKGIAVNNDGRTVGPASPNLAAQKAVMQKALKQSGLNAEDVVYIETNASGSATTDLVELKAIRDVYRPQAKGFPLNLGSVKPNIGHTLCSEAMAAIIKVVLMLEHAQLVPFLSGQQSLPHFDMRDAGMVFPRQVGDWPAPLLAAAVSSFADGGTNTHAILAAADPQDRMVAKRQPLPRPILNRRDFSQPVLAAPVSLASSVKRDEPIAIIGMAGRYPGANDVAAFWDNLKRGVDSVTKVPPSRWALPETIARTASGEPPQSRYGGLLDDADKFDCDFFHISRPEVDIMDPQECLFLQTAWEALEDAGHTPSSLTPEAADGRRKVGVFVGVMHKDHMLVGNEANARAADDQSWLLSINQGQIANRVSFAFDLHGPSMAVDTLYSSSLTAVHLAVESLRAGESDAVIAGGVNLSLHKAKYETYGQVNMHSSDGLCRAFGTVGDGYVSSEGVGAFVLKRLSDAKASGDHIYAVIRASATNHVGRSSGFSVPNPVGQAAVIGDALERSGLNARSIGYIEAHGTGTMLGDPVEVNGLTKAFRQHTDESGYCALGSVKSNIGHAESADGIGSLTKTALQLRHKLLVPSLHADPVNPMLQLDKTPFRIQRNLDVWPAPKNAEGQDQPRRAGVSAFGATGSNVHMILEEYTEETVYPQNSDAGAHKPELILLSARTQGQLHEQVVRLLHFIRTARQSGQVLRLADIAYTLRVGREPQPVRWAGVIDSLQDLDGQLEKASVFLSQTSDVSMATVQRLSKPANETQLSRWIETGDLQALGQHWMAGGALDRAHLPLNGQPRRISLPTYPFARIRHWIGQSESATQEQAAPFYS